MDFFDELLAQLEPILPGLITAALFLVVLALLRLAFRGEQIGAKLRVPVVLTVLYLVLLVPTLLAQLYWSRAANAMAILSLLVLSLAVILGASFGLFDLFLGRYRRIQVAAILRDIVILVVYVITIFVVLGQRGVDLTSILTTSAVLTAVVGFALQDLLSNIIAGLALQIERPFHEGDWVMFDDQEGEVLELNWRSTKIKTLHNDIVVIPNNVITRSALVNLSSPTTIHRRRFTVGLRYEVPPNRAKASILAAVRSVDGVLEQPPPYVNLKEFADFSINYRVHFYIDDLERRERIEDAVRTQLWYQLKRDGLSIPFPIRDVFMRTMTDEDDAQGRERELGRVGEFLGKVPFLEPLSDEELQTLARGTKRDYFAARETIIRQGEEGASFFVISQGRVAVRVGEDQTVVARLGEGDFFGEMSLMTGEVRAATVVAECDCELYVIDKSTFQAIIVRNEDLIAAIGQKLVERRLSLQAKAEEDRASVFDRKAEEESRSLVTKIRKFFNIR